ncbi:MAG TPA: efflux RND transporter periplasmic adaptor subunit [Thiotrichales bacterium]|nr:efflux RND transporter periplasmic adaptor subunit [Thiotrichales bacterium]
MIRRSTLSLAVALALVSTAALPLPARAAEAAGETALEHAQKHLDPKYVCPMHPQIIRDEPGNCPICGMDLVPVEQEQADEPKERKILYYRHPHKPDIISPVPRKDEMGMDFVPVYDDGGGASVKITPAVINNLGVRTAEAERGRLWRRIDTVGFVDYDENLVSHIHLRTDGWIEKLHVKYDGERVKKGQVLFEVYSPKLVNAQEEYLNARRAGGRLVKASAERLRALGVSDDQIDELARSGRVLQRVKIHAPQDGIVARLKVRQGMYVKPMNEVMSIADLSRVWVMAEVFEKQVDWVQEGQSADVRLDYLPGEELEGRVEFIYPELDPRTRTLRVRLSFPNPEMRLKPNMYASVAIYGGPKDDVVFIPREALIRTGRESRVILAVGEGRFQPREVVPGIESGDYVEIRAGLEGGEKVVTSGQFLIDSEASLKASLLRMQGAAGEEASAAPEVVATGTGELKAVGEGSVNLAHDPIEALGWPAMTMDFELAEGASAEGIAPGTAVEFDLIEGSDGYLISAIRPRDGEGGEQ